MVSIYQTPGFGGATELPEIGLPPNIDIRGNPVFTPGIGGFLGGTFIGSAEGRDPRGDFSKMIFGGGGPGIDTIRLIMQRIRDSIQEKAVNVVPQGPVIRPPVMCRPLPPCW